MNKDILLRWENGKDDFCIILNRDNMCKEISSLISKYEDAANDDSVKDLKDILQSAQSIYLGTDIGTVEKPVVFEYWYLDGNTSKYTLEPEEISVCLQKILEEVIFRYTNDPLKKEIPEKVRLTWITKGHKKEKDVSRQDLTSIFSPYIYTDAMNNGIAKRIISIVPYSLSWYINWDNDAEINALYYEYGEIFFKKNISIPGIHRKIWGEFKKLCDIEN